MQLGDGTARNQLMPVAVVGLHGSVTSLALGEVRHGYFRLQSVACRDCTSERDAGLTGRAQGHSCAVHSGGAVSCWGWNSYGQVA